jgi:hypothetical protein
MSSPGVLVIMTSLNCGACVALHKSGEFCRENCGDGKTTFAGFKWNAESIWKLITANENPTLQSQKVFNVIEIEFYSMQKTFIQDISAMTLFSFAIEEDDDGEYEERRFGMVHRDTFARVKPGLEKFTLQKDESPEKTLVKGSFNNFLVKHIPQMVHNYAYQFPLFGFFSAFEWQKALKNPNYSPYGKAFGLITGRRPSRSRKGEKSIEIWGPIGQDKAREKQNSGFVQHALYLANNPDALRSPESSIESITNKKITKISKRRKTLYSSEKSESDQKFYVKIVRLPNKGPFINY